MNDSDVENTLRTLFGIDVERCRHLPGEADLNTHVIARGGEQYVFKVHSPDSSTAALDMQDAALAIVAAARPTANTPRLVGRELLESGGEHYVARLLSWVDGRPADASATSPDHRRSIGNVVANTDGALVGFEHAATERQYHWNMLQCADIGAPSHRWAAKTLQSFATATLPHLLALPQQAIHNDANDANIIVAPDGSLSLIDYGDVVHGPRIIGLGVAAAYAMLGQVDPLAAAADVVSGYHEIAPLAPEELSVLDAVIRTRLAMSIAIAELQVREQAGNADYLLVSQAAITDAVALLAAIPHAVAHATYRDACGYVPIPSQRNIEKFFGSPNFDPAPIVTADLSEAQILDWSGDSDRNAEIPDDRPSLGRYAEVRSIYDTDSFATTSGERRTLHLGIDIFVPDGQPACSPLAGHIHSCDVRDLPGDYGGVVILEYRTPDDIPFWLLVGHLDHASVKQLTPGQRVERGAVFARVGGRSENGGWAPHLHVQLFTDLLGLATELDGVARASERGVWMSISPNPAALVIGVDRRAIEAGHVRTTASIARRRQTNLSPSLSLSYDEPLHVVRGEGAELIDVNGRRWLDLVNNVAHVGHEHRHVVNAITEQVRQLNTNTRYLHPNIVDYAERLRALFPDPLTTVFLTNSGSEAVDLALRLAQTATARDGVLTLDWAYHGNLTSLIEISPYKFNRAGGRGPSERVRICELPDPFRGAHGPNGAAYADHVARQAHDLTASGHPPAAFIHESISGCGGQIDLAPGYLEVAYAHARAAGALCIADEVQCGLGRVGADCWAFEQQGVVPDIVAMGKPLGNGHPLGAVITTPRIARSFANGMEYFNTFGGNPVSCAAGLAVLDVLEDERLRAHASKVGNHLIEHLRHLAGRHPAIGDVRGRGLFIGVDLVTDDALTPATDLAKSTTEALRRSGILISTDGPHANVLKIKPPMVISSNQADAVVDALDDALANAPY
ncbi:MAG: 4-aminobutyrate aminotransferase-like enzyme/Ser/Thr protein kinase RdoA (MazF antagonist) [Gammaproteobacteria bacterium]|jgi:4-aminobutyrate aminotransferase-like enzyme/Ser/Thr protein kinase RdoA (MazF antagonist)